MGIFVNKYSKSSPILAEPCDISFGEVLQEEILRKAVAYFFNRPSSSSSDTLSFNISLLSVIKNISQ